MGSHDSSSSSSNNNNNEGVECLVWNDDELLSFLDDGDGDGSSSGSGSGGDM